MNTSIFNGRISTSVSVFLIIVSLSSAVPLYRKEDGLLAAAGMQEAADSTGVECTSTLECIWNANKNEDLFEVDILSTQQLEDVIESITSGAISIQTVAMEEEERGGRGQGSSSLVATSQAITGIPTMRWPDGIVPYRLDPSLSEKTSQMVLDAIEEWENVTCIRFIPKDDTHEDSVYFSSAYSCSSYVGRIMGEQPIFIGACRKEGTIVHEIGHALGFWHEQSRPDREDHVTINWENIRPGKEYNFFEFSDLDIDSGGVPYDPHSIMQYSSYAFTTNNEPTIVMKDTNELIFTADHLSVSDILQANIAYGCAERNCSAHSDDDSASNKNINSGQNTSFIIQNRANGKCLSVKALTGEYPSSDPVDGTWVVTLDDCDPHTQSQYWFWSSEGSWIIHKVTGSCLSFSTSTGVLVSTDCSDLQSVVEFLCAGYFIEHPETEQCLTAVPTNIASIPQTKMVVQELETDLLNAVKIMSSNKAEVQAGTDQLVLTMAPCNISNKLATWRIYDNTVSLTPPTTNEPVDKSICNTEYQLEECYNKSSPNINGWLRCTVHGYFVSDIRFRDDMPQVVSSVICCRSPYSYWGHIKSPALLDDAHSSITCNHRERSLTSSTTQSSFECKNDEYLKGVQLDRENIATPDYYYSLIDNIECCHPVRDKRVYRHCHAQPLSPSTYGCSSKGYFVTSLTEVVTDGGNQCDKTVTCCV